jgi:signal transduction histidine kinase
MREMITDLVSNAIKHDRPGGFVRVTIDTIGEHVRVAVSDTGLGIAADALPNLGRELYRVKTCETREIVGAGFGPAGTSCRLWGEERPRRGPNDGQVG